METQEYRDKADPETVDSVLVQQALKGDQGAFEALVSRYKKPLLGLIHHYVGEYHEAVFRTIFRLFRWVIVRIQSETARDTLWAFYAPLSVMLLPLAWVILLMIGFAMMLWGVSETSLGTALTLSGAAITTEGFLAPKGDTQTVLYIIGGIIGLGIVGLLITFLPTVYAIYSQREQEVWIGRMCPGCNSVTRPDVVRLPKLLPMWVFR